MYIYTVYWTHLAVEMKPVNSLALHSSCSNVLACPVDCMESNHNTLAFPKSLLCQLDDLRHLGSITCVQCTRRSAGKRPKTGPTLSSVAACQTPSPLRLHWTVSGTHSTVRVCGGVSVYIWECTWVRMGGGGNGGCRMVMVVQTEINHSASDGDNLL